MRISKAIRILGYVLLFFIGLFIIVGVLLNVYFNKKLIENVKERISESSHGKYVLSLDRLSINILNYTITVNNLIIAPSKLESSPKAQFVFKAKVLRVIDFSIMPYLKGRDLLINRVEFEEPQISIFQGSNRMPVKEKMDPDDNFSIYTTFSKRLNSISIDHIDIMNSRFNIYKNGIDTLSIFSTNDNSISIKKFSVNPETDSQNRLFFAEKFEMVMNKFSYNLGSGLYSLYGKNLSASYIDSTLIVDSVQLIPNFSKKEFADEAGQQISRAKINLSKLSCKKMDVKSFFEYNSLIISKVDVEGCVIDIYRDNTLPLKHIERPSFQAMVKGLPFFVSVDSIEMKNAEVKFEVLNPGASSTGKVTVNKMNAIITGVKNDTLYYTNDQSIKVVVNGFVFNQGKFNEVYTFPLKATKEFFYCSGSLSAMSMVSFNPIIEPAKHISIKSGQLDSLNFSFVADENSANGTMKFRYHDLKIEVMNKEGEKSGLKEKVKTFLANKLIVKDSNPGKDGHVRMSRIYMKRNPYRAFIFYSMQSVLSGIQPAIEGKKR
ncbi:MAG: hypothetical protein Q8L90_07115 [Bacteroidota bacterium]|nr:hypothetical protein [Bacteroidota bacterium]